MPEPVERNDPAGLTGPGSTAHNTQACRYVVRIPEYEINKENMYGND